MGENEGKKKLFFLPNQEVGTTTEPTKEGNTVVFLSLEFLP